MQLPYSCHIHRNTRRKTIKSLDQHHLPTTSILLNLSLVTAYDVNTQQFDQRRRGQEVLQCSSWNNSAKLILLSFHGRCVPSLHNVQHNLIPCINWSRQAPMHAIILNTFLNSLSKGVGIHVRAGVAIRPQQCQLGDI